MVRTGLGAFALAAVGAALAAGLAGCGLAPDSKAEAVAKLAYQDLVQGNDKGLEALMAPAVRGPGDARTFAMMRTFAPPGAWQSMERTNWRAYAGTSGNTLTYEETYHYADRTVTATSVLIPSNFSGGWWLTGFHVNASMGPGPAPAAPAPPAKAAGGD